MIVRLEPVMNATVSENLHATWYGRRLCGCARVHHVMFALDLSTCGVSVRGNTERLRDTGRGA